MNVTRTVSIPGAIGGRDGVYAEAAAWARSFVCVTASGSFRVQIGQGNPSDGSTGVSFVIPEGAGRVTLSNSSAAPVTVTFVFSDADYISQPDVLSSTILVSDAQSQAVLLAGSDFTYPGTRTVGGMSRQRKVIEIDLTTFSGVSISLKEGLVAGGRILARIKNNTNRVFNLSSDLCIHNDSGDNCLISVYEIF